MCSFLQQGGNRSQVARQQSSAGLDREIHLRLPSSASHSTSHSEMPTRAPQMHSGHSLVAATHLVSNSLAAVSPPIPLHQGEAAVPGPATTSAVSSQAYSLAPILALSQAVQDVLLNARKPSTRRSYHRKWECYISYLKSDSIMTSSLCSVLDFLLHLEDGGLGLSSARVYLSAISAYHNRIEESTVFSHPLAKQFLRGLRNLHPSAQLPPPAWDLPLVLRRLTAPPFEMMLTCKPRLLAWKTAFLVATLGVQGFRVGGSLVLSAVPGIPSTCCQTTTRH